MPNTLLQPLPYPASSAAANVPLDIQALAAAVEQRVVMPFASSATRTSTFAAAGITPTAGMTSYLTGLKRHEVYDGANWAPLPGTQVGFHRRTSTVNFVGTEIAVCRANAPLITGYRYQISTSPLRIGVASGETGKVNMRYSITGGNVSNTDTVLDSAEANANTPFTPVQTPTINATYAPGSNVTISVGLYLLRSGGSGNVTLPGSTTQPIEISIICTGPDTGDTGADL